MTGTLTITILVFNYAALPADRLAAAMNKAERVFQHAQVEVLWQDCHELDHKLGSDRACAQRIGPLNLILRLQPRFEIIPDRVRADAMGFSTGDVATVSLELVERMAEYGVAGMTEILGHAIAHEIGHILLRGKNHSAFGLMRARWDSSEWLQVRRGTLFFTTWEATMMRDELVARSRNRPSEDGR